MRRLYALGLGALGSLAVVWATITSMSSAREFEIAFGVVEFSEEQGPVVRETREIPLRLRSGGFLHGVQVTPADKTAPYEIQFVHRLPAPPAGLTGRLREAEVEGRVIRGEPRVIVGEEVFPLGFDRGDPHGEYGLSVIIDGETKAEILYSVIVSDDSLERDDAGQMRR